MLKQRPPFLSKSTFKVAASPCLRMHNSDARIVIFSDLVGLVFAVMAVCTCEGGFNVESYRQA